MARFINSIQKEGVKGYENTTVRFDLSYYNRNDDDDETRDLGFMKKFNGKLTSEQTGLPGIHAPKSFGTPCPICLDGKFLPNIEQQLVIRKIGTYPISGYLGLILSQAVTYASPEKKPIYYGTPVEGKPNVYEGGIFNPAEISCMQDIEKPFRRIVHCL